MKQGLGTYRGPNFLEGGEGGGGTRGGVGWMPGMRGGGRRIGRLVLKLDRTWEGRIWGNW